MPRPSDEWFYQQRIEGLIPHVDQTLDRIGAARRSAERCSEIVAQASPQDEVRQRQELRELVPLYQQFRDEADTMIQRLRASVDAIRSDVLRSRSMSALRELSDDFALKDLPEKGDSFLDEFERRLLRNRQAALVRESKTIRFRTETRPIAPSSTTSEGVPLTSSAEADPDSQLDRALPGVYLSELPTSPPDEQASRVSQSEQRPVAPVRVVQSRPTQEQINAVPRPMTVDEMTHRPHRSPGVLVEGLSIVSNPNLRASNPPAPVSAAPPAQRPRPTPTPSPSKGAPAPNKAASPARTRRRTVSPCSTSTGARRPKRKPRPRPKPPSTPVSPAASRNARAEPTARRCPAD